MAIAEPDEMATTAEPDQLAMATADPDEGVLDEGVIEGVPQRVERRQFRAGLWRMGSCEADGERVDVAFCRDKSRVMDCIEATHNCPLGQ